MPSNNIINLSYGYVVGYLPTFGVYENNTINSNVKIKQVLESQSVFMTISETVQMKNIQDETLKVFTYE